MWRTVKALKVEEEKGWSMPGDLEREGGLSVEDNAKEAQGPAGRNDMLTAAPFKAVTVALSLLL